MILYLDDQVVLMREYVTGDVSEEYLARLHEQRNDGAKMSFDDDDQILDIHNDST